MHRESWPPASEKGEEHPGRHHDIDTGTQGDIDDEENWCLLNTTFYEEPPKRKRQQSIQDKQGLDCPFKKRLKFRSA
ncbi:hypothetical protein ACJ73_08920 [Blastomyces percursus]|uniref:Uncharacterized protein n=1 Tax=Blastomyces percursus TaxID=1658174 RepID=A0A1J9PHS1_9EURO|nr:hypothetical protein ACJ73_08920 [Blastomyces percursus]